MNVFLYSEDKILLLTLVETIRNEGDTPYIASDFQTLLSIVTMVDPDIAFVDENVFPQSRIKRLQQHVFEVFLDFPVTSITNPYFTDYRGTVSESKFRTLADAVMTAARSYHGTDGLSPKLSSLLSFFMEHKGEEIRTDILINYLWHTYDDNHVKTLRSYICKLREKLSASVQNCTIERTSKGTYCLMEHPST